MVSTIIVGILWWREEEEGGGGKTERQRERRSQKRQNITLKKTETGSYCTPLPQVQLISTQLVWVNHDQIVERQPVMPWEKQQLNKNHLNLGLHPLHHWPLLSMNYLLLWMSWAGATLLQGHVWRDDCPDDVHSNGNDKFSWREMKLSYGARANGLQTLQTLEEKLNVTSDVPLLRAISFDMRRQAKWKQEGWGAEVRGRPFISLHTRVMEGGGGPANEGFTYWNALGRQ